MPNVAIPRIVLYGAAFSLGGALAWSQAIADTAMSCRTEGYELTLDSVTGVDASVFEPYKRMKADGFDETLAAINKGLSPSDDDWSQGGDQLTLRAR